MSKFKEWLHDSNTYVYINDENDEIVSEHTNGEILFGITGTLLFLIAVTVISILI